MAKIVKRNHHFDISVSVKNCPKKDYSWPITSPFERLFALPIILYIALCVVSLLIILSSGYAVLQSYAQQSGILFAGFVILPLA